MNTFPSMMQYRQTTLYVYYSSIHSCCVFMNTLAMSCPEDRGSQHYPHPVSIGSCILSTSSSEVFPEPQRRYFTQD